MLPDDPSFGPDVQVDDPGYRSTRLRAPDRPLVPLPEEVHDLAGPVFGDGALDAFDDDLTRQHDALQAAEAAGLEAAVLDEKMRAAKSAVSVGDDASRQGARVPPSWSWRVTTR